MHFVKDAHLPDLKEQVETKFENLHAFYYPKEIQDACAKSFNALDVESELAAKLQEQIEEELVRKVLGNIVEHAKSDKLIKQPNFAVVGGNTSLAWSCRVFIGQYNGVDKLPELKLYDSHIIPKGKVLLGYKNNNMDAGAYFIPAKGLIRDLYFTYERKFKAVLGTEYGMKIKEGYFQLVDEKVFFDYLNGEKELL